MTIENIEADDNRSEIRKLARHCNEYRGASTFYSIVQLTTTLGAYIATCAWMLTLFNQASYGYAAALMVLASGLLVRLFIIQHDCGHSSFFKTKRACDWTGRLLSVLTFTPYDFWRRAHAMHHNYSGNLDHRGVGSLDTITVSEYLALGEREQRIYRLYRAPMVQLFVIPILYIFFVQRFPPSSSLPFLRDYASISFKDSWKSIFGLDIALIIGMVLMGTYVGWAALFFCYIPTVMLTSLLGGWLFFIQHQYEDAYWARDGKWSFREASLYGSSYYVLPKVLQYFSGNIGIHHVHHLNSMIPNYRLQACIDASPELKNMNRMTIRESFKCLRWALWDEEKGKMIPFSGLKSA
jgi:acyl-lipid omega-6 desaturase (Delta-12 desaturase)